MPEKSLPIFVPKQPRQTIVNSPSVESASQSEYAMISPSSPPTRMCPTLAGSHIGYAVRSAFSKNESASAISCVPLTSAYIEKDAVKFGVGMSGIPKKLSPHPLLSSPVHCVRLLICRRNGWIMFSIRKRKISSPTHDGSMRKPRAIVAVLAMFSKSKTSTMHSLYQRCGR